MPKELSEAFQRYGFKAGFLKLTVLKMVSKGPIHGYALMKEIERLTDEDWKPSPGSIYPALQELVADGLVTASPQGRRKLYEITPKGQEAMERALGYAADTIRHLNRLLTM